MKKLLGLPELASQHGADVDNFIVYVHWLMIALFVGWLIYFVYTLWRFRASRRAKADPVGARTHASNYIEGAVVVAEGILLIGFALPAWKTRAVEAFPSEKEAVVIRVTGRQFNWMTRYPGPDGVFGKQDTTSSRTTGVTAPQGFQAAGIHCGIKKPGILDLALLVFDVSGPIAGVFTKNQVVAAPVILDPAHLKQRIGRAILVNSGNANACTGKLGMAAALTMATIVAKRLKVPTHEVFVGSTGVIGRRLPIDCVKSGIPTLFAQLSPRGGHKAAQAILTTDLRPKECAVRARIGGRMVTIGGMAKGSGMIHPNMATPLLLYPPISVSFHFCQDPLEGGFPWKAT